MPLRFAEAVAPGHPDRLADAIGDRLVRLSCTHDPDAIAAVEVALHRRRVFVTGRIAAGEDGRAAVGEAEVINAARQVFREAGYGDSPSGLFPPEPDELDVSMDLALDPLSAEERAMRAISDDQAICVGHAVWGPRAGHIPVEQALAIEFVVAVGALRIAQPALGLGPDGKALVVVRGRSLVGVSLSVHHRPGVDWAALTGSARTACERVAAEYVTADELLPLESVDWLVNGVGAFEAGGPLGDNGLSGKKLVAQAYGSAVPIGGGASFGKDPRKVDPRGQALARRMALDLVLSRRAREATVWLAWRPGDVEPRWVQVSTVPPQPSRPTRRPAPSRAGAARPETTERQAPRAARPLQEAARG